MAELSRDDVVMILGRPLSDAVIAEIIATGVTKDELAAARDRASGSTPVYEPPVGASFAVSNSVSVIRNVWAEEKNLLSLVSMREVTRIV